MTADAVLSGLASVFSLMGPVFEIALIGAGVVMAGAGVVRLAMCGMSGEPPVGFGVLTMGVITAAAGALLVPYVNRALEDVSTATPSLTPPTTPQIPDPPSEPVDLTWLWALPSVAGGIVAVGALAGIAVYLARRVTPARARAAVDSASRERLVSKWAEFRELHDQLLRKILVAETDWDALFFTPALSDPTVPATGAMLRAMRKANTLRDTVGDLPPDLDAGADLTVLPYPLAVEDFALAWEAAENHARRVGQSGIPEDERRTIGQIRTLLDIAENSAASETERLLAYRRARNLVGDLQSVHIPRRAMEQLEARKTLMISGQPAASL